MEKRTPTPVMAGMLIWTMLAATMNLFAFSILAAPLIEEFGVSRTEIGLLGAANTAVAALFSVGIGRIADRLGAARAVTATMGWAGLSLVATGLASSFYALMVISAVAGIGQAGANPSTNRLISEQVPVSSRGVMTGLKQSGVQFALFLGGFTLPTLSGWYGWRTAIVLYGAATMVFTVVTGLTLGVHRPVQRPSAELSRDSEAVREPLPPAVNRIAVYGFLIGVAAGGYSRFLPLFVHEKLGMSIATAGSVAAVGGLAGIVARITLGRLTQNRLDPIRTLATLALISVGVLVVLTQAVSIGPWIAWPISLGAASSSAAWNVVGMLAIIQGVPTAQAGVAAGRVMSGFLFGLAISGPLTGGIIDSTGSYATAFAVLACFSLAAFGSLLTRTGFARIQKVH